MLVWCGVVQTNYTRPRVDILVFMKAQQWNKKESQPVNYPAIVEDARTKKAKQNKAPRQLRNLICFRCRDDMFASMIVPMSHTSHHTMCIHIGTTDAATRLKSIEINANKIGVDWFEDTMPMEQMSGESAIVHTQRKEQEGANRTLPSHWLPGIRI